ncbi:MAG: RNA polymerase sigma-70 factor [Bacteroidota bacterium]
MMNIMDHDSALILALRRGSEKHFEILFDQYWSRLYAIANNTLDRPEDAEDVVQEVFIDIWKRKEKLEVTNLGGYLYACVRYGIAKKIKKSITRKTEELFDNILDHTDLESRLELQDLVLFVEGKIDALPDRCKEIFKLSRFQQLSNREIAQKLDLSISTVENQINKALKALKSDKRLLDELTLGAVILILSVS